MSKIELFSGLNSKELKDVENIAKVLTFARGETVFNQGDYSSELYIIETGQVEISVKDILQNKRVLSIVKNGDFFGEMALFDKNSTRSATAKAVMNTNLIVIPRQEFERLLQSRPQISFKLLSALSRRLREANLRSSSSTSLEKRTDGRVIVVAAPQNGYGKTTMATTLAHLLTAELEKRVLYIDLDLCFGEGTFVMGIYSPRSIVNLCQGLRGGPPSREDLFKHFVRITDNLFVVPAPTNFLDGENVKGADLVSIIKTCKPHFDYIIIDSDSSVEERLLNAFDLADHILFLVQTNEVLSLKSNVRYFHGLEKLNYPEDRMSILIGKVGEKFDLEKSRKLFKFKVIGGLPFIPNYTPQYGRSVYHLEPTGNFVAVARGFMKGTFREEFPGESESGGRGFLYRLFFDKNQKSTEHNIPTDMPRPIDLVGGSHPSVSEEALSVLLKYIRTNVIYGNLEEARFQTLKLLEFCQNSSTLYQILGEIFMLEKNFSEAIDAFKRAIEIDPENYLAIGYLGDLSSDDACFERAVSLLKAKLEKTPNYPDLLNDMGKLLYKKGDYAKAEQMFRTALEKNVGYLEGHINLAVVLGETGKFDQALKTLELIEPKNIRVFYLMGKFFHATGRFFESLEAFTRAAEIKPNYFDVGERLDELQDYFHRLFTLITMHQELLRAHPNYPDLHYKMGNLYRMVGKRQEAEAEFKEALKLNAKYDLARSALQDLQATPLYTIGATNIVLEKAQASASAEPVENFQIELELSEFVDSPRAAKILGQCLVRVKNIRTGRILEKVLPPDIMSGKTVLLDCTRLGTIALNDTLLVQLFDQTTNTILNGLPHSVSEGEIQRRLSRIGISPLFEVIFADKTFTPPVRYFLVNFQSKDLADSIAGQNARYSAHLVNTNSGASCIGTVNEENPAEINFVLMAMGNEDVVHLGDKLRFKIQDKKANTIFSMDFPVAQVDIENFSKSVAFETPERDGEPVRPPRGSVDVAMESSSSDDGRTIIKKG